MSYVRKISQKNRLIRVQLCCPNSWKDEPLLSHCTENHLQTATGHIRSRCPRWEPLSNQYKKKLLILIYKVNRDITPDKIANLFSIANQQHNNLRNSNHFVLPRYNFDIGRGPLAWQLTPTSLKHSHSLKNFKNLLKERRHKNFINDLNFLKETCMVSHKNQDFKYF